jgi:PAS domain S-box-containing protein
MTSDRIEPIWDWLTAPSPAITEPEQRRNARLFSALLVTLAPLGYVVAVVPELLSSGKPPLEDPGFVIMTVTVTLLAVAYCLSRTRHYPRGVLLALGVAFAAIYLPATLDSGDSVNTLYYLLLLVIFSSIMLPVRSTIVEISVCLVALVCVPLLVPSIKIENIIVEPFTFLTIGSGLILVNAWHRDQLERDRRAALLASEIRYRTLAEAAPDMIFILDRAGIIQYVNVHGARQMNRRPDQIIGQSREQLFPFEPGADLQAHNMATVFEAGQSLYIESQPLIFQHELWLGTWLVPLKDETGHVTAVLGIARDITAQKRATQVQTAMYRISEAAQSTRDLEDLYHSIHVIISDLMPADNFYIALYDHEADLITFPYLVDQYEDATPMRPGRGLTSYVLRTGQPILFTPEIHTQLIERGEISVIGMPAIDWLGAPLKIADRIIGVIAVQTYDPQVRLRETDKDILVFVSSQVAMAIERKRAAEAEHEQRVLAEALRDSAAALNSTLYLDEVFDRILSNVGRVVAHDASSVMSIDAERTHVNITRANNYPDSGPRVLALSDFPTLRQLIETQQPVIISDTRLDPDWIDWSRSHWIRSHLSVPIRYNHQVIGLLSVDSAQCNFFTPAQSERLQAFADQAAVAIENARLHQALDLHADELEQRVYERTRQLAEANDQLQELDRMKDQFVSNVSHELRTPIANVKLYLSLLTRGKPEKYEDYLSTLRHETARLEKLIEDLLDLSRLDLGTAALNLVPTDLNHIIVQLVADRSYLATDRGLCLQHQLRPDLPLTLADPLRLEQVVANLLANAMNYTPPDGQITLITSERDDDQWHWITLTVADTGPGVSPKDLPHLFERFFRGEVGRRSGTPGTGLGLAICHEIISKLDGHITVESESGMGSRFTVWLKPAGT